MFRLMTTALLATLVSMPCSAEFRDPTTPAYPLPSDDAVTAGGIPLVLSAIWISSHSRRATINGILAKQGQVVEIQQAPTLNPEQATTPVTGDNKTAGTFNKAPEPSNGNTNQGRSQPPQGPNVEQLKNMASPMGDLVAPLLSTATGSMDVPQLQKQNTRQQANAAQRPAIASRTALPPASMQSPEATQKPVRSSTIKIIDIHKNSVTIDQNGERKTLHLVQRPYKKQ